MKRSCQDVSSLKYILISSNYSQVLAVFCISFLFSFLACFPQYALVLTLTSGISCVQENFLKISGFGCLQACPHILKEDFYTFYTTVIDMFYTKKSTTQVPEVQACWKCTISAVQCWLHKKRSSISAPHSHTMEVPGLAHFATTTGSLTCIMP